LRIIFAMAEYRKGDAEAAQVEMARARKTIQAESQAGGQRGDAGVGFWYDWAFARILMQEAGALMNLNAAVGATTKHTKHTK
jgi:hypothetical protein